MHLREVQFLADLRQIADELLDGSVASARSHGATWQQLGDILGTTRQAAWQRYGHPPRT